MSHINLDIERNGEHRCAYCLEWNPADSTVCESCTASLTPLNDFGAARALVHWENCDPRRLKLYLKDEESDRVSYWNDLFHTQKRYYVSILSTLDLVLPEMILDLYDDIEKALLAQLPLTPDQFKKMKEYELPDESLSARDALMHVYRAHPVELVRRLAALGLARSGNVDKSVYDSLIQWRAPTNKLYQELLLSLAHWTIQHFAKVDYRHGHEKILPLMHRTDRVGDWSKLYLYLAHYNIEELRYELEDIAKRGLAQLSLSCALALKDYAQVRELLGESIDEQSLALALRHGDERIAPALIRYLKHSRRHKHQSILRKLNSLKLDENFRGEVLDWLLDQSNDEFFEDVFGWENIPKQEQVLQRLSKTEKGLQIIEHGARQRLKNWDVSMEDKTLLADFIANLKPGKHATQIKKVQMQCRENYFQECGEAVEKKFDSNLLAHIIDVIFMQKRPQFDNQNLISWALSRCMLRALRETGKGGKLILSLEGKSLDQHFGGLNAFTKRLKEYFEDGDYNSSIDQWLRELFSAMKDSPKKYKVEDETLCKIYKLVFDQFEQDRCSTALMSELLGFLKTQIKQLSKPAALTKLCKGLETHSRVGNIRYHLEELQEALTTLK